jgi:indolepyruvate ferredoxin oxidoreductase alpha subunit
MKAFMLGNEAVARGLYEAGVRFVSSYPGTPSTEITEYAADYDEIYAEWAPNEKVALEAALGASVAGARSFCGMKHVGLNVAADPLFICSYVGGGGGFVIGVADDPGMHSSQNEQDSRHYAIAAKLPMLEPCDSAECLAYTKAAYELSEKYNTPVLLRLSTRVSHSRGVVDTADRTELPLKAYEKDPKKYVMMPGNAKGRHVVAEKTLADIKAYAKDCPLNKIERGRDNRIGIITAGIAYTYAKEAFGDSASYLKLGLVNPLPDELLLEFASSVERVIIVEDLDPVIETACRALGIKCDGKTTADGAPLLPLCGEYSQQLLREVLLGEKSEEKSLGEPIPPRPPVLCPGCPHRGVFYVLGKLKLHVSGDIGCYTLGAVAPLSAMDTTFCMGASISALHGYNKVLGADAEKKSVAVIGDSTFMHSGMTGLVNVVYNGTATTTIILDNSITGMTGHQQNPLTGLTLKNTPAPAIHAEDICAALGVAREHIRVVDPYDIAEVERVVKEELDAPVPSVIICRRPCVLLKYVKRQPPLHVDRDKCKSCRACMKPGCPCISFEEGKAEIDANTCVGCGLCAKLCRFGAISEAKN